MTAIKHNVADIIWKRPGAEIQVTALNIQASISDLYVIQALIKTKDPGLDFQQMLHAKAEIVLKCGDLLEDDRIFSGIITRFSQGRTRHGNLKLASRPHFTYEVEIRPALWMLTRQLRSKVFQQMTCKDIVSEVLSDQGLSFQWQLAGSPRMREYCVQYEETDYNFISRLLEDEGICFYFDQEADQVIFSDHAGGHLPCRPKSEAMYVEEISPRFQMGKQEFISDFNYEEKVTTGSFAHNHYNYETSQTSLLSPDSESNVPAFPEVEYYEHTLNYVDGGEGKTLVALRKEGAVSSVKVGRGTTSCRSFDAGFTFSLSAHFRMELNKDWLLTQTQITVQQGSYQCRFTALPCDIPYRPPHRTVRPRVTGIQTAVVTGPDGAEIYLDEMGRCKLQFHWDREGKKNDRSSMWVRVSNNYAGKDYGIQWIPRVGHEVLVTFINGDPDLPVVTGRVYNDFMTAPLGPDRKTQNIIKTIKDNHILFDDKDDDELVQIRAQKNMNNFVLNDKTVVVEHDLTESINNDSTEYVKKNKTVEVDEEDYSEKTGRHKIVEVGKNYSQKVGKTKSQEIGKDHHLKVKAAQDITVAKNIDIQSESGHVSGKAPKKIELTSGPSKVTIEPAGITLKLGGNIVKITPAGVTIKGTIVKIN